MKFDQVIKHNFDQTPILLETFDQLIRSSEIRSSDHFPSTRHDLDFNSLAGHEHIILFSSLFNDLLLHLDQAVDFCQLGRSDLS